MKLVLLHRFKTFGGAERQLIELARGLHKRGHDVSLITFYPPGDFTRDLSEAGVPVISLDKKHRWDIAGFMWRLIRTMRREHPDVVHGYLGFANALLVMTKPLHRAKVVWGVRASDIDNTQYGRLARFDSWIEATLSRFPDLIISNSHSGKRLAVSRGFPESKMTVIPNGIDIDRFQRNEQDRDCLRAEWNVASNHVIIGRVGRIAPQKDFPTFLRAAALVVDAIPGARFALVGNDRYGTLGEIEQVANELGIADRMIWGGERSDMAAVYSALDLCVSSSAYGEGVPNVLAESMACGTPCVTTDVGDSAITIGSLGPVVPPKDPEALAVAIISTLGAPADRQALRDHVAQTLSLDALIATSEQAILSVVSGPARLSHRIGSSS